MLLGDRCATKRPIFHVQGVQQNSGTCGLTNIPTLPFPMQLHPPAKGSDSDIWGQ